VAAQIVSFDARGGEADAGGRASGERFGGDDLGREAGEREGGDENGWGVAGGNEVLLR